MKFSPGGRFLAATGQDANVEVWDIPNQKRIFELPITPHPVGNPPAFIGFHPSRSILAVARYGLEFWNLSTEKKLNLLEDQTQAGVDAIAFAPDARWFVLGTHDSLITIWNLNNGRRITRYRPHEHRGGIGATAFSRDGNLLASSSSRERYAGPVRRVVTEPTTPIAFHRLPIR